MNYIVFHGLTETDGESKVYAVVSTMSPSIGKVADLIIKYMKKGKTIKEAVELIDFPIQLETFLSYDIDELGAVENKR